jgi:hypothetical protein
MTEAIPERPERDTSPEYRLFNLDAMTDEQIVITGRGYLAESDRLSNLADHQAMDAVDEVRELLHKDFGRLVHRNPERARRIISGLIVDMDGVAHRLDRELAATLAPGIAPVDYEFAKQTLLRLCNTDAFDSAVSCGNALLECVTPEQAEDFREARKY